MSQLGEKGLTSGELLMYATAVVWENRRIQKHIDRASRETAKRLKSSQLNVLSF